MRRTVAVTAALFGLAACQDLSTRPPGKTGDATIVTDTGGSTKTGTGTGNGNPSPSPSPQTDSSLLTRVQSPWATVSVSVAGAAAGGAAVLPAASKVGLAATGSIAVLAGGLTSTGIILAEYATASTAAMTSWSTASLPVRICDMGMGVDSLGRFVMVGGITQDAEKSNTQSKKVFIGTQDAAGKVTWSEGASLGVARAAMGFTSFKGRLYVVAGQPDPPSPGEVATSSVLVGSTEGNGAITWAEAPPLPELSTASLVFGPAVTVAKAGGVNRIYVLGGLESSAAAAEPRARVWKAELDGATGMPVSWTAAAPMPEGRAYNQAYQNGTGHLIVVGGLGPGPQTKRGMLKAAIDGTTGDLDWLPSASELPLPLQDFGLILFNGTVTIAGGTHIKFTEYSNEVLQLPLSH